MSEKFTADRTTKVLLATIAVALWGLLLRPFFAPVPARAQQTPPEPARAIVGSPSTTAPALYADKETVFVAADGFLTYFQRTSSGYPSSGISLRYPANR